MLRYWTTRYLATLFIGLLVVGVISAFWIRHSTLEHRLNLMEFMAEELVDRIAGDEDEDTFHNEEFHGLLEERNRFDAEGLKPDIYIYDVMGNLLSDNISSRSERKLIVSQSVLESTQEVQKIEFEGNGPNVYMVKEPIEIEGLIFGWVVVIEKEENLTRVNEEYRLLGIMLVSLALLGWIAIYFLSKKLAKPIAEVAFAAKRVQEGDYDIRLPEDVQEREVYDLVESFKEMTSKLERLEELRAELLAGVTHELKTPVTSISGLLQAIKDDVVTGDDAKEFLAISLKEVSRMQKMVADLLEFNSFAAHTVPVSLENYHINELVKEISYQWKIVQDENDIELNVSTLKEDARVSVDASRLQQILVNLLNNARQAIEGDGKICIRLERDQQGNVVIDVEDNGGGIPLEDQPFIFERFFRGENKKYKVRGLGLGLAFSRMLAKALNGELLLKASSSKGTTFSLVLPIIK